MARGINDIDLIAFIVYSGVLGENGDAALALEIAGIHHALRHDLIFAVNAALLEHLIDQGGLAVVNVRDNGNITDLILGHTKNPFRFTENLQQNCILTHAYLNYKIFLRKICEKVRRFREIFAPHKHIAAARHRIDGRRAKSSESIHGSQAGAACLEPRHERAGRPLHSGAGGLPPAGTEGHTGF